MTLVNGSATGCVAPDDRGLHYGDGLFETLAVLDGRPLLWSQHLERLRSGCARLGIVCPDESRLLEEALTLCRDRSRAVLKLIVTRGRGGRGYRASPDMAATRIVSLHPWPDYPQAWYRDGITVRLCTTALARQPLLAGLKHLNRLEQVLARREWDDPDIAEGLMCDDHGQLIEGTMSNVFMTLPDGTLVTPALDHCGVRGILRDRILAACAQLVLPCEVRPLTTADLDAAGELFVCNSIAGIWPIQCVSSDDGRRRYLPGALSTRLRTYLIENEAIAC